MVTQVDLLKKEPSRATSQAAYDEGTRWHVAFHVVGNLANILSGPEVSC